MAPPNDELYKACVADAARNPRGNINQHAIRNRCRQQFPAQAPGTGANIGGGAEGGASMPPRPQTPADLVAQTQQENFVMLRDGFLNPGQRLFNPSGKFSPGGQPIDPITPLLEAVTDGTFMKKRQAVESDFKGKLDNEKALFGEVEDLFNKFRKQLDAGNQVMSSGVAGGPKKAYDVDRGKRAELNQNDAGAFVASLNGLSESEKIDRLTVLKYHADHAVVAKGDMKNIGEQHQPNMNIRSYGGFIVGGRFGGRGRNGTRVIIGR